MTELQEEDVERISAGNANERAGAALISAGVIGGCIGAFGGPVGAALGVLIGSAVGTYWFGVRNPGYLDEADKTR